MELRIGEVWAETALSKNRSRDVDEASFGQERNRKVFSVEHGLPGRVTKC
jgi:hypothetical protein